MPIVVLQISLSNAINIDGRIKITVAILISAPLAIRMHIVLMTPMSEYSPTPNVAVKNPIALVIMEGIDIAVAVIIASLLFFSDILSVLYLVDVSMA